MRKLLLLSFFFSLVAYSQEVSSPQLLKEEQVQQLFPTKVKKKLGVEYPIFRVYILIKKESIFGYLQRINSMKTQRGEP